MEIKHLGKKGMFLTFISISMITIFLIMFKPFETTTENKAEVIKTRVLNVNSHVLDLEDVYLERTLQSSSIKAITALILYLNTTETFLTDFEAIFKEVLSNGSIGQILIDETTGKSIMENNTYRNWTNKIINISKYTYNIDANFTLHGIDVYQTGPWYVNVDANVSLKVLSETASWKKNVLIKTRVDIAGFYDPYYLISVRKEQDPETKLVYMNLINKSTVIPDKWEVQNVTEHIEHGTYTYNPAAPSFLQRFTGDVSASDCCGIQGIVNPDELDALGFESDVNVDYVDYKFFESGEITPLCDDVPESEPIYTITGLDLDKPKYENYGKVKLDFEDITLYQRTGEAVQECPESEP
ncbi:hypothetical protein KY347_05930 [Candidatus Woesearchaeota archaeon]|nr:hypothetical protein [Candidatus Woesearchaeota archaeon]